MRARDSSEKDREVENRGWSREFRRCRRVGGSAPGDHTVGSRRVPGSHSCAPWMGTRGNGKVDQVGSVSGGVKKRESQGWRSCLFLAVRMVRRPTGCWDLVTP